MRNTKTMRRISAAIAMAAAVVWTGLAETVTNARGMQKESLHRTDMAEKAGHGKVKLWADGPYWATTNIGANNPWEFGLYFWWGDTTGHRPSSDGTFRFGFDFNADNSAIYTSCKSMEELQGAGWVTNDGVLAPEHDAAHVHWGGAWRMPTPQELSDLNSKCDWTWTTMDNVKGYVVRGKGGYASNCIFLPAAGIGCGTSLGGSDSGLYWSSVPNSGRNNGVACELIFSSGVHGNGDAIRSLGLPVRPVHGFTRQRGDLRAPGAT